MTHSVAAVVVTRNRVHLLGRCINALLAQSVRLDAIYVVDNASTDGTREYLASLGRQVVPVLNEANSGSAGGQSIGMMRAYKDGHRFIWCGDDDGYPASDSLERLLGAAVGRDPCWVNCMVVDARDHERLTWALPVDGKKTMRVVDAERVSCVRRYVHPFNGTLLSRSVCERIGLPHEGLFIWGDEQEYNRRAETEGIYCATVTTAKWYHPANESGERLSSIPFRAFWKHYYAIRNANAYAIDIRKTGGCARADVRLSGRDALERARDYVRSLFWDEMRCGLIGVPRAFRNIPKGAIVARAVWAAFRNDQRQYYP